ncbi:MAG: hypothetical protein Q7U34_12410 [Anaerolineales bacterium]|nr:hypothetical protein [Anaerolineales bacterium]
MNTSGFRSTRGVSSMFKGVTLQRGFAWGIIILCALLAFEIFNYSTTQFALQDVLGNLTFAGMRWATILAIAFCGIDFAGIARLFTPQQGRDEPAEVWYLFGAWLLAAGMNAILTWWGVSVAIVNHSSLATGVVVSSATMTKVVPVFVAIMVWLIRVLIIGTFSIAGERLFSSSDDRPRSQARHASQPAATTFRPRPSVAAGPIASTYHPAPKVARPAANYAPRAEPTYHPISMNSQSARDSEYVEKNRRS